MRKKYFRAKNRQMLPILESLRGISTKMLLSQKLKYTSLFRSKYEKNRPRTTFKSKIEIFNSVRSKSSFLGPDRQNVILSPKLPKKSKNKK